MKKIQEKFKNALQLVALFVSLFFCANSANGQAVPKLLDPNNPFIIDKALDIDEAGGVVYYKNNKLKKGELFTIYSEYTGLGIYDSMALVEITNDVILEGVDCPAPNLIHAKYQQYYKGLLVEGAEYTEVYEGNNDVIITSGSLFENINLIVRPSISKLEAINNIKLHLNCETYSWEKDSILPNADLIIIPSVLRQNTYVLVWKFAINGFNPLCYKHIYINALNGNIEKEISLMNEGGDFNHNHYGAKNDLDTRRDIGFFYDDFYLMANDGSRNIYTTDERSLKALPGGNWQWDLMCKNSFNDHWGNSNQKATSTHYCVQKTWDYFKTSFANRNGMTGWGKHLRVHGNYDWTGGNFTSDPLAFYLPWGNEDYIAVTGQFSTYDAIGHEFTHGIIEHSNKLPTWGVGGAVNESFADIFGLLVEKFAKLGNYNWTVGEDERTLRDMQNPNNYGDASYYLQPNFWRDPMDFNNDNGGVHHNNGVQNKWFYLLTAGGSQKVFGQNRFVSGIGIDKAARIAYYAMTQNSSPNYSAANNTTFDAVRANTIVAARILYGICSNEYVQTCKAWYAVNVGNNCEACLTVPYWRNNYNGQQSALSIKERENELLTLKLFPNPANDKITILCEEVNIDLSKNEYNLSILTIDGKLVYQKLFNNISNLDINIGDLKSGVYFVNINTPSWNKNIKFVKQ